MKNWLIVLSLAVIAGTAAYFAFGAPAEDSTQPVAQIENTEQASTSEPEATDLPLRSGYFDYSPEALAENADKSIVIFFHAEWCPNCRAIEKTLTTSDIPDDIVILKADYDTETDLKEKYGVTYQTTMVHVDGEGNKLNLWIASAFDNVEDIKEKLM